MFINNTMLLRMGVLMELLGRKTLLVSVFKDRGTRKAKVVVSDGKGRVFGLIKPV